MGGLTMILGPSGVEGVVRYKGRRRRVGTHCRYDTGHDDHREFSHLASSFEILAHLEFPSIIRQLPDFGYVASKALPFRLDPREVYVWELR